MKYPLTTTLIDQIISTLESLLPDGQKKSPIDVREIRRALDAAIEIKERIAKG